MKASDHILSNLLGIARRSPEAAVLRLLVELGIEAVGADEGSLLALDREKDELVFTMTAGSAASEKALLGQRVPVGKGLTGLAARTGEVQIGAPTFKDIRQRRRSGKAGGPPAVMLAAPMLIQDELIGVITAACFDPERRFTGKDASLYGKVASVAGVVVAQQRRLRLAEDLRTGRPGRKGLSGRERSQLEVIDRVTHLAHRRPDRLRQIASLLEAIEDICSPPSP